MEQIPALEAGYSSVAANTEGDPVFSPSSSIPRKRAFEEEHQPPVRSPLNFEFSKSKDDAPAARERAARAKKESFKKRESKGPVLTEVRSTPDSRSPSKKQLIPSNQLPVRYMIPPRITDFVAPQAPTFTHHHTIEGPDGQKIEFQETSDHVFNKKGFRYTHCVADPTFPSSNYFRQSEVSPYSPRINFEDQPTHLYLDKSSKNTTTDKGFRMTKANVCVREGRFYWECKITSGIPKKGGKVSEGHVRIGWARREATLESMCGFDAYSYGIRDVTGQKVHLSRPQDFFPKGENIEVGDVIGLEINLPSEQLHRKVVEGRYNPAVDLDDDEPCTLDVGNIIRDRVPIRFKSHLYYEQIDYQPTKELEDLMNPVSTVTSSGIVAASQEPRPTHPIPALRTLPGSNIKIYKNGVYMGEAFKDLLAFLPPASNPQTGQVGARDGLDDGMLGYYPALSVFRGGAAEINLGPDFWFPPPASDPEDDEVDMVGSDQPPVARNGPKPMSDRYNEQIAEDIVWDIVDEVDFWARDDFVLPKPIRNRTLASNEGGAADGDIKELVQDED